MAPTDQRGPAARPDDFYFRRQARRPQAAMEGHHRSGHAAGSHARAGWPAGAARGLREDHGKYPETGAVPGSAAPGARAGHAHFGPYPRAVDIGADGRCGPGHDRTSIVPAARHHAARAGADSQGGRRRDDGQGGHARQRAKLRRADGAQGLQLSGRTRHGHRADPVGFARDGVPGPRRPHARSGPAIHRQGLARHLRLARATRRQGWSGSDRPAPCAVRAIGPAAADLAAAGREHHRRHRCGLLEFLRLSGPGPAR